MAFPTASRLRTLTSALERAQQQAASIKAIATNNRDRMARGAITAGGIISLADNLRGTAAQMVEGFDVENPDEIRRLVDWAEAQLGTTGVEASFRAMLGAIRVAVGAALAVLPHDENGWLLISSLGADGNLVERSFTTEETADLRAALDAVIAAID